MPNLAMELAHLALADRHIAAAHDRIAKAEANQAQGSHSETAKQSLALLKETLGAFENHRALILQAIADAEAAPRT